MPGEFYIEGKAQKVDISLLVAAAIEIEDKLDSIVVYRGKTTGDGAVDGSTLICADLATKPDYDGNLVVVKSGAYAGEASQINGATTGGSVAAYNHFGGQIANGVSFAVLGIRAGTAAIAAIEAKLDDASHGLAALKALIDTINTNQGDPSADTLKSTAAKIGDLARSLATIIGTRWNAAGNFGTDITTLLTNLGDASSDTLKSVVAKIGDSATTLVSYLSTLTTNLGDFSGHTLKSVAAAIGDSVSTLVSLIGTAITNVGDASGDHLTSIVAKIGNSASTLVALLGTLTTNLGDFSGHTLTSIAAAIGDSATTLVSYLSSIKTETDKLKNTVSAAVYAHPNSIAEQDAYVFAAAIQKVSIRFDMSGLAQKTTVREKEQVDGANYRGISAKVFPDEFDAGAQEVVIDYVQANALYKITFQSAVLEGGVVNVPYRIITQDLS